MNRRPIFCTTKAILIWLFAFFTLPTAFAQTFTNFRFTSASIGWETDLIGVIDNNAKTISFTTQRWIENIAELPADFVLDDTYSVKVGGIEQTSGITKNDFRKNVVYTIGDVDYTVKFASPQASGLPVIRIDTGNGAAITSKINWVNMTFSLTDPNDSRNDVSKTANNEIRGRGNSTWSYAKKPYRIRLFNKTGLMGLPAAKNWVLLAEYQDPTFLMNAVAFELGRSVFQLPFTCSYQHVQLYLNGQYNGLYGLTEHRQADPNEKGAPGRVKVDLNEGWFVELDSYWDEDPKFKTTNYSLPIVIKSPEFEPLMMSNPAFEFVRTDWNKLCNLMISENFPENGYRDLIDLNTFVDFLLANEIVRNGELWHPKSTFSYKDKGGKINMGPLWDFDWAFSYAGSGHSYFGTYNGRAGGCSFFERFFQDPVFLVKFMERWNNNYDEIRNISTFIENTGKTIRNAVAEDTKRWNISGGYWSGYDTNHERQTTNMKNWWVSRMTWLHTELNIVKVFPENKTFATQSSGYSEITPQIFTLVTYDDVTNLSATLQKKESSDFEITDISKTPAGNGGYLTNISVKPRISLSAARHSDGLVLSGSNQGKSFSMNIPLTFVVEKANYRVVFSVAGGNGTVGAKNNSTNIVSGAFVEGGKTIVFTAAPNKNFYVKEWIHNGLKVTDNTSNSYTVDNLSADVTVTVVFNTNIPTDNETLSANPLKAWANNGLLHVSGLTAGETLSVYAVTGSLVYHSIVTSDEAVIPLKVQGLYIVHSGNQTIKIAYY